MNNELALKLFYGEYNQLLASLALNGFRNGCPSYYTMSQRRIRAKRNALRIAAGKFMKQTGLGYSEIKDDVISCEDRAIHYGLPIGSLRGKVYIKSKQYDDMLAQTIRLIRGQL